MLVANFRLNGKRGVRFEIKHDGRSKGAVCFDGEVLIIISTCNKCEIESGVGIWVLCCELPDNRTHLLVFCYLEWGSGVEFGRRGIGGGVCISWIRSISDF